MTALAPLSIDVIIAEGERSVFASAAAQLAEALTVASGESREVRLRLTSSLSASERTDQPVAVVASLVPDILIDEPVSQAATRWRARLTDLKDSAASIVFLCTVFRGVDRVHPGRRQGARQALIERIRRLNLLAMDLSHDFGVNVIDIDRACAYVGARALRADFRLASPSAQEAAAYAIVSALLAVGLDDAVPVEILEEARRFHGPIWEMPKLIRRRLALRETLNAIG